MYTTDARARIADYDRMRTQTLRMKNLIKKSYKLKEELKKQSKGNVLDMDQRRESHGVFPRSKRGRSNSPEKSLKRDHVQSSFIDPSMFW